MAQSLAELFADPRDWLMADGATGTYAVQHGGCNRAMPPEFVGERRPPRTGSRRSTRGRVDAGFGHSS